MFTFCKARWARRKKIGKKITQLKWPKYQKPKDENMGWTKQLFRFSNLWFNIISGVSSVSSGSTVSVRSTRSFNFDNFSNFQNVNLVHKNHLTRTTVSFKKYINYYLPIKLEISKGSPQKIDSQSQIWSSYFILLKCQESWLS